MKAAILGLTCLALLGPAAPGGAQGRGEEDDGKAEITFKSRWKVPIQAVYVPVGDLAPVSLGTVQPGQPFLLDTVLAGVPPGKPTPVALRSCKKAGVALIFGAWTSLPPPADDECDDDDLGAYPWGDDDEFDLGGPRRPLMKLGLGAAAVALGAGVATQVGGGDSAAATPRPSGGGGTGTTPPTTPAPGPGSSVGGTYGVISSNMTRGFQHRIPIGLQLTVLLLALQVTGSSAMAPVTITGDGNWQPLVAEHAADNSLRGTGRGTFAGFPNTPFQIAGTLSAASGDLQFTLVVGGGTLPGGEDAVYEITARRR